MDGNGNIARVQHFVPLISFIIIIIVGGFCFRALDGSSAKCIQLASANLTQLLSLGTNITTNALEKVLDVVEKYYIRRNSSEKCRHLSLIDWLYFSGSILLTIGMSIGLFQIFIIF